MWLRERRTLLETRQLILISDSRLQNKMPWTSHELINCHLLDDRSLTLEKQKVSMKIFDEKIRMDREKPIKRLLNVMKRLECDHHIDRQTSVYIRKHKQKNQNKPERGNRSALFALYPPDSGECFEKMLPNTHQFKAKQKGILLATSRERMQ